MHLKVLSSINRIDSLQDKARSPHLLNDLELQAQFAQLLCVHTSGLLETALAAILSEFSVKGSRQEVGKYASHQLFQIQNANFEKIMTELAKFDPAWREHFEANTDAEVKDAVNSIVNNRHQIAHGRHVGVSLGNFTRWYGGIKSFLFALSAYLEVR